MGIERGRSTRPKLKVGICGEHGGDYESVKFCHRVGMNYVSCSPFRVPIARLAAAHAALEEKKSNAAREATPRNRVRPGDAILPGAFFPGRSHGPSEEGHRCFGGANRAAPGEPLYMMCEELGREIAAARWTLLNGAYGGAMEAAARGARENGGRVIGVPVAIYSSKVNPYVNESVMTKDLWERIRLMLDRSDAFIAVEGSTGTLAEVGMAWEFIAKKLLPPKPLIFIGDFWAPLYQPSSARPTAANPRAAASSASSPPESSH